MVKKLTRALQKKYFLLFILISYLLMRVENGKVPCKYFITMKKSAKN